MRESWIHRAFMTLQVLLVYHIECDTQGSHMKHILVSMHSQGDHTPHQKFPGDGCWTPVPLFCLICTIISNKTGIFDQYQNTPQVLAARSFLVAGFDTHVIPRSFACGMRSLLITKSPIHPLKSPTFPQKRPIYPQKSVRYEEDTQSFPETHVRE